MTENPHSNDEVLNGLHALGLREAQLDIIRDHISRTSTRAAFDRFRANVPKNILAQHIDCNPSYFLCLSVHNPAFACTISFIGFHAHFPLLKTILDGATSALGLRKDEGYEAFVKTAMSNDFQDNPYIEKIILKGQRPVPSKPSTAELLVKAYNPKAAKYQADEQGNVDYKNLELFQNVVKEQHIASHKAPVAGLAGKDVFGNTLPVEPVEDRPIECGANVFYDENTGHYLAMEAGYLRFDDNRLSVEDTYQVNGHVDFKVGNINFVSNVEVTGDVLSDFSLSAQGNVSILGTVSGAAILAGKNLTLKSGVAGQGKAVVRVGGDIKARYLNEARVEVGGEAEIMKECINSSVNVLGKFEASGATIIGGRLVGLKEMRVETLGSVLGVRTEVFLGEDYRSLNSTESLRREILDYMRDMEKLLDRREALIEYWSKPLEELQALKIAKNQALKAKEQLETLLEKLRRVDILVQEYELLSGARPEAGVAELVVQKEIHSGVIFFSSGAILEVKERLRGPIRVRAQRTGSNFRIEIKPL